MKRFQLPFLLAAATLLILVGCAGKPNAVERWLYNIDTNRVERVTMTTNGNVITVQTNVVLTYTFVPKPEVETYVREGSTLIGSFFGMGGILSTLAVGAYAAFAKIRGNKAQAAAEGQTANVQVARELLAQTAGAVIAAKYKQHLIDSQKADGTKATIEAIVDEQKGDSAPKAAAMLITKTP